MLMREDDGDEDDQGVLGSIPAALVVCKSLGKL